MDKKGLFLGIAGGLGLGLIIGSEFSGSYITLIGAFLTLITIISIVFLSIKEKKKIKIFFKILFFLPPLLFPFFVPPGFNWNICLSLPFF